jgi:hypothetical protein
MRGTHQGEFMGIAATGRQGEVRWAPSPNHSSRSLAANL